MGPCTKVFDFSIGDRVVIPAIKEAGRVMSLKVSIDGTEYLVAYWFDGERKAEWLMTRDLEPQK